MSAQVAYVSIRLAFLFGKQGAHARSSCVQRVLWVPGVNACAWFGYTCIVGVHPAWHINQSLNKGKKHLKQSGNHFRFIQAHENGQALSTGVCHRRMHVNRFSTCGFFPSQTIQQDKWPIVDG